MSGRSSASNDQPGLFDSFTRDIPVGTVAGATFIDSPTSSDEPCDDERPTAPDARATPAPSKMSATEPAPPAEARPVVAVAEEPRMPASSSAERRRPPTGGKQPASRRAAGAKRETAETMAARQRDISVSEFFAKNRHLLGFDNKRKALLTTVKEAVDNALDACEEASIAPEIHVTIDQLAEDRFRVSVRDNGPGIVKQQIPNIFGKLLYGSKFHRLKMSRGQQGIGISAAGMYGLLTTGKAVHVTSRTSPRKAAHHFRIAIDTTKNRPDIIADETQDVDWSRGTDVSIELEASYAKGKQSVDEYLEQTAIANPHAAFFYKSPGGERREFPRGADELPAETKEIKPHPYGIELGVLMKMLKEAKGVKLAGFLQESFSRVSQKVSDQICKAAGLSTRAATATISNADIEKLYRAMQEIRIMAPPTDCLAPIGVRALLAGLLKEVRAEFFTATTRPPTVYRGNPFQIEVAIAFGGQLPGDQSARVIRFANRVPLLYQQSACAAFKSVLDVDWRNYGMSQPGGAAPAGPLVVMLHMASVWVPFTSESKEAIADYDEIRKEMKLALQECGRKLGTYIRRRQRMKRESQKRDVFERYIGEISRSCAAIANADAEALYEALLRQARRRTEIADAVLNEDGKIVGFADGNGRLDKDEDVVIVESQAASLDEAEPTSTAPTPSAPSSRAGKRRRKSAAATRAAGGKRSGEAGLFD